VPDASFVVQRERDEYTDRVSILDERVERVRHLEIEAADITHARTMATPALAQSEAATARATREAEQAERDEERQAAHKLVRGLQKTRVRVDALAAELGRL